MLRSLSIFARRLYTLGRRLVCLCMLSDQNVSIQRGDNIFSKPKRHSFFGLGIMPLLSERWQLHSSYTDSACLLRCWWHLKWITWLKQTSSYYIHYYLCHWDYRIFGKPLFLMQLCRNFATSGVCAYGAKCRFIHDVPGTPSDLQLLKSLLKLSGDNRLASHNSPSTQTQLSKIALAEVQSPIRFSFNPRTVSIRIKVLWFWRHCYYIKEKQYIYIWYSTHVNVFSRGTYFISFEIMEHPLKSQTKNSPAAVRTIESLNFLMRAEELLSLKLVRQSMYIKSCQG